MSAPTVGGNEAVKLPDDQNEAIKYVFQRLQKLQADRRWSGDGLRDLLRDAKAQEVPAVRVKHGVRLAKMSPEKREKWADDLRAAAELFGYSVDVTENDDRDEAAKKLFGFVERYKFLEAERRLYNEEIAKLLAAAKGRGIDPKPIVFLSRVSSGKDRPEMVEWFEQIDSLGAFLQLW